MSHVYYGLKMCDKQYLCHFGTQTNKQFKQTLNAQHFWFALGSVLPSNAESEPVRFGLLNWALVSINQKSLKSKLICPEHVVFCVQVAQLGF